MTSDRGRLDPNTAHERTAVSIFQASRSRGFGESRSLPSRTRLPVLLELLVNREEISVGTDADGADMPLFDVRALFHGQDTSEEARISIGLLNHDDRLRIGVASLKDEPDSMVKAFLVNSIGVGNRTAN